MTFLAIQAPFITRRCGICGKQYLKEKYLKEDAPESSKTGRQVGNVDDQAGMDDENPKISLARLLFAVCDRCTFCGGKFIG